MQDAYYNYLAHHGILGMHWGIRRYQPYPSGYTGDGKFTGREERKAIKKTQKMAIKDAKRYAEAKMYYGEGAGIRRRHLQAELAKKKKDPVYKEAFNEAVEKANYAEAAKKAKTERKARDAAGIAKSAVHKYVMPAAMIAAIVYYNKHAMEISDFVWKKIDYAVEFMHDAEQKKEAAKFLKKMGL